MAIQENNQPEETTSKNTIPKHITKQQHDLISALRTLNMIASEVEGGYRFEDADAPEVIRLFRMSIERIENFCIDAPFIKIPSKSRFKS